MPLYASTDFTTAREIAGSGVRQFSEFNHIDFILVRQYIQLASAYKPLPRSLPDAVYKTAYLVGESEQKREFGHVWFTREYATVPQSRTDHQEVVFTFPGRSAVVTTTVNGEPVKRWDRYGRDRPATVPREALVQISYTLGKPTTDLPTQISYDGQAVDFTGRVYSEDGSDYLGSTSPSTSPSTFVMSDVARQWRGDIWERTRITVSKSSGAALIPI